MLDGAAFRSIPNKGKHACGEGLFLVVAEMAPNVEDDSLFARLCRVRDELVAQRRRSGFKIVD